MVSKTANAHNSASYPFVSFNLNVWHVKWEQFYLPPNTGDASNWTTSTAKAGTRFVGCRGMKGWVDLNSMLLIILLMIKLKWKYCWSLEWNREDLGQWSGTVVHVDVEADSPSSAILLLARRYVAAFNTEGNVSNRQSITSRQMVTSRQQRTITQNLSFQCLRD